jgi:hypothetical protein
VIVEMKGKELSAMGAKTLHQEMTQEMVNIAKRRIKDKKYRRIIA